MPQAIEEMPGGNWPSRWLHIIITALVIPVVTAIIVWTITKEPRDKESVYYDLVQSGTFGAGEGIRYIYKVDIFNVGLAPAKNIAFDLSSRKPSRLIEYSIFTSRTRPRIADNENTKVGLKFNVPSLLPKERISVYAIYQAKENPDVRLISKSDQGIIEQYVKREAITSNPIYLFGVFAIYAIFIVFSSNIMKRFLRGMGGITLFPNRNNAGFILLHAGLPRQAEKIFSASMERGDAYATTRSNLAVALSCLGQNDEAQRLIKSAENWAFNLVEKNLIAFNKAIINKDLSEMRRLQKKSVFKLYIERSALLREIFPELYKA